MAAVFKRNRLADIPLTASINGSKARWRDSDGRERRAPIIKTKAGPKIVVGTSPLWFGKLRVGLPPSVRWQTIRLFKDKSASERRLSDLQREADRRAAGVVDAEMDHAGRPLAEHIGDYLAALKQSGVADDHHRIAGWQLGRLVKLAGWKRISDINPDGARGVIAKLAAEGKATSYCNKFISAGKALIHWLQANNRMTSDPLAGLKRGNVNRGKKTRARRAMTDDELTGLLEAAPEYRRRRYLFAALSGLRRGELAGLKWDDLRLRSPIPFIQLREDQTKNAKADAIPLHPALVRMLGKLVQTGDAVFGFMPDMKSMVKDLTAAGLSLTDARDRRIDFHSLRHTFKSNVERTGCTQAVSDALTRHGDKTVADGYRHAELAEMRDTLAMIPDLSPEGFAERQTAVATGTDGNTDLQENAKAHQQAHQTSGATGLSLSTSGKMATMALSSHSAASGVKCGNWRQSSAIDSVDENAKELVKSGPSTQAD